MGPGVDRLLLLRHGIAEERRPGLAEADRALTARGQRRTAAVVAALARYGLAADRLLSSPLTRARQTAELALAAGLAPALAIEPALQPGGDVLAALPDWFAALADPLAQPAPAGRSLLLVGHEPDLGDLACRLLGGRPGGLPLRKAGLALLELPGAGRGSGCGEARLRLLLSPRLLLGPGHPPRQ